MNRVESNQGAVRSSAPKDANLQPIDMILTGVSSSVAVYAAAASLASEKNAQFFMWVVMAGTLVSSLVVWYLGKSKLLLADTTAYTLVALGAALGISTLNNAVPDTIYTGPLMMAGILSWMLALGSFVVWRDQTMLFQAVPAIALFGLVGCYDTFRASVFYFFVFLVCQAILLARAHGRTMLRQARSSGVEALEMAAMRRGPWRWMAGPEWALASALTIVLLSVIGAPILRESASGFSGLVKYTPPISKLMQPTLSQMNYGGTRVGTGPNNLSDRPILRLDMPEPMYLRATVFGVYDQGAWLPRSRALPAATDHTPLGLATSDISDPREVSFRIEPLDVPNGAVPVPGEVQELTGEGATSYFPNAMGSLSCHAEPPLPVCEGRSIVFGGKAAVKDSDSEIGQMVDDYVQQVSIPGDVQAWAVEVTKNCKTDYDKAVAIQQAIARVAKYNLNAPATPAKQDPVSYFLFTSKEGYCDLFASAMTLMARSVGLPARYVTGYYPFASDKSEQGRYVVRQRDSHAWCEILFKGGGWMVFDPTEGAASVDGAGRGSANDLPFWQSGWFLITSVFSGVAGLGYLLFAAVGAFRRYRSTPSFAQRHVIRARMRLQTQVRNQYITFERELRRIVRRPRGIGETIFEYTEAAEEGLGQRSSLAWSTGAAFASALYAQKEMDQSLLHDLRSKVKSLKQARRARGDQ